MKYFETLYCICDQVYDLQIWSDLGTIRFILWSSCYSALGKEEGTFLVCYGEGAIRITNRPFILFPFSQNLSLQTPLKVRAYWPENLLCRTLSWLCRPLVPLLHAAENKIGQKVAVKQRRLRTYQVKKTTQRTKEILQRLRHLPSMQPTSLESWYCIWSPELC